MSLGRKAPKEFTVNDEKIMVRPLGMKSLFRVRDLKDSVSEAIAKLMSPASINDFEKTTHGVPQATERDPDAMELTERTTTAAASPAAITQAVTLKQQGIAAIFECLGQDDLLGEVLKDSVDTFRDMSPKDIIEELDIPSSLEIFGCIVEVNVGGFDRLGKYWSPLKNLMGLMQDKDES